MRDYTLADEFGRNTIFRGQKLVAESTDTALGDKPKWLQVEVYRTEGGNWVVYRATHYRIRHSTDRCIRADGYALAPARRVDTYLCRECGAAGEPGELGQLPRITVDSYSTVDAMIASFRAQDGVFSSLARAILADISEQDERVNAAWNTVFVP
jgi:hypothetical protein